MTHRARLTAESLGISGFYWSRLWTVIGFLLPFINLVRPWLGLGETRRAIMNSVRSGRIGGEWSQEGGTSFATLGLALRSEEHKSELQSLMRISYAVFSLK